MSVLDSLLMHYPPHLTKVIEILKRLPSVGNKSAERFAFHLLTWKPEHLAEMAQILEAIPHRLKQCTACGCLRGEEICHFCGEERARQGMICVIASPRDAFAIEETREYKGLYHVLGGLLSPLDGLGPDKLSLKSLKQRIQTLGIKEVVVALDSTLEGDTTSLYLKRELEPFNVHISRLAFGLPMGSSLDYVDGGTLARALSARNKY